MSGDFILKGKKTVGVISDTHGLLRHEALRILKTSSLIIHAGDIGKPGILEKLRELAPVAAVRGNMDSGEWVHGIPRKETIEIDDGSLYILHDIGRLDIDPSVAGIKAVISGHSHRPSIRMHNGVLYLNPGSAGPRRHNLPVSVAILDINDKLLNARIVDLRV